MIVRWFHRLWTAMAQWLINAIGSFLASILSHQGVQHAGSRIIQKAMTDLMREPDFFLIVNDTISKNQAELARKHGEDFPKIVGNFFQGMFVPKDKTGGGRLTSPLACASQDDAASDDDDTDAAVPATVTPPASTTTTTTGTASQSPYRTAVASGTKDAMLIVPDEDSCEPSITGLFQRVNSSFSAAE